MFGDSSASDSDGEEVAAHEAQPVWIVGSTAQHSSLDNAIVSNGDRFNPTFQLICCVVTWYVLSISLTLGNKMIFSGGKGITAALPCPLIITALHIGMKVPLARFGMRYAGLQQISFGSWNAWLERIAPVGLAAALDIGLSNASLVYISVTQYTVVKSSAPMWILMISVALGLQKPKPALVLVVLSIASGIALASQPAVLVELEGTHDPLNPGPGLKLVDEVAGSKHQSLHADALSEREPNRTAAADDAFDADHATRKALFWLAMDGDDGAASLMPPAHFFRSARHARKKWQGPCREDPAGCGWLGSWTWSAGEAAPAPELPPAHAASRQKEGSAAVGPEAARRPVKWFGLLLVLSAAICGAFRWAWMEFLLRPAASEGTEMNDFRHGSKKGNKLNPGDTPFSALHPLALVSATASLGFSAMLPVALYLEIPSIMTVAALHSSGMGYVRMLLLRAVVATLTGGLIAFAMLLVELRIVQLASSLTLSIAGVLKEVLTVAASAALLGDVLSLWNALGLALCVAGIAGYQWLKHSMSGARTP